MLRLRLVGSSACLSLAALFLAAPVVEGGVRFDFNTLAASKNSKAAPDLIESYMESAYGSDVTVDLGAHTQKKRIHGQPSGLYLGNSDNAADRGAFTIPPGHLGPKDTFLVGRWKHSLPADARNHITITFEEHAIGSVAFDWEVFGSHHACQGASITVLADGAIIFTEELAGDDKKLGDLGHLSELVFAQPVKTLEIIGSGRSLIGIDNLLIGAVAGSTSNPPPDTPPDNPPCPIDTSNPPPGCEPPNCPQNPPPGDPPGDGNPPTVGHTPAPSTLVLLAIGIGGLVAIRQPPRAQSARA